MRSPNRLATCVICAPLPTIGDVPPAEMTSSDRPAFTVTWYGTPAQFERFPPAERPPAIAIPSTTAESRRDLRDLLQAGRRAVPELRAAVFLGAGGVRQPDLLVEEGITVVLTSQFSMAGRPRRPAPAGWPCRSVEWGLWELLRHDLSASSWKRMFFGSGTVPRLRPGSLTAIDTATPSGTHDGQRLRSLRSRLSPRVAAGSLIVPALDDLPDLVSGGDSRQTRGSILRAA